MNRFRKQRNTKSKRENLRPQTNEGGGVDTLSAQISSNSLA